MILLDTHALIWWVDASAGTLSPAAAKVIDAERDGGQILVSSISVWEIATLVARGRLALSMDLREWMALVEAIDGVRFVPIDNEIALTSVALPDPFYKDPADRMIVATARKLATPLVTADERLRVYAHVRTIW